MFSGFCRLDWFWRENSYLTWFLNILGWKIILFKKSSLAFFWVKYLGAKRLYFWEFTILARKFKVTINKISRILLKGRLTTIISRTALCLSFSLVTYRCSRRRESFYILLWQNCVRKQNKNVQKKNCVTKCSWYPTDLKQTKYFYYFYLVRFYFVSAKLDCN